MPDIIVKHRLCVANHCSPPLYRHLQYGGGNFEHLITHYVLYEKYLTIPPQRYNKYLEYTRISERKLNLFDFFHFSIV